MQKYIQLSVKAGNRGYEMQMKVEKFEEKTGITLEDDDTIYEGYMEDVAEFVENSFDEDRYEMQIDEDAIIRFTGYRVIDEDDEEFM